MEMIKVIMAVSDLPLQIGARLSHARVELNVMLRRSLDPDTKEVGKGQVCRAAPAPPATFCRPKPKFLVLPPNYFVKPTLFRKGTPIMAPTDHHHRSTTKQAHKPYKSKHMSKGAIKDKNKGA
jgi:hypothetical protein